MSANRFPLSRRLLLGLGVSALASGCVVAPVAPRHYPQGTAGPYPQGPSGPYPQGPSGPYPDESVATLPPPAPQYEVVGVAPAVGMIWLAGYWAGASGRYVWRPGYWTHGRPGHRWVPHAWVQFNLGWRLHPGHWRRH